MRNAQVLPVVVGITLCTASAALFYKWYKTRNSGQDAVDGGPRKRKPKQPSKVEMMIETDMMPLVLGRNGNNIKSIEERHSVKITFREKDKEKQVCEISGLYENMMKASTAISDEVKKGRDLTEEIVIPKTTYTKISSQILRDICRETATQIRNKGGLKDKNLRQLEIKGAFMNVQKAKRMIEDQVREDSMHREHETKREPRYNQKNSPINSSMESLSKQSSSPQPLSTSSTLSNVENFNRMPNNFGGQMEVYVSAVASPARFWVQIVTPQIKKLDDLITEMTEYYGQTENQEKHRIKDPYLGQIVAAMFQYDNKWYRAEIVAIVPNEYDPRRVALDLYFLDFGDSIYVDTHDVFELRTDFLTLRYQAVECFLANVQPVHPLDGGQWNHNAINRFEEITHVAKWKKLTAKTVKTRERFKGYDTNSSESSTIPGIELYDVVDDHEVNLASILILESFAVPANQDDTPTPLSRYSSSESVLRLDGGSNSSGSVAEKAMMFELTANMQNSRNNSPKLKSNGIADGQKSPLRFSASPRRNLPSEAPKENGSVKNLTNDNDDKNTNFQDMLTQQMTNGYGEKLWSEIMDAES